MAETHTYSPAVEKQKTKEPLSFNLLYEKQSIEKDGSERTHRALQENMEFWGREYIAGIPSVHYVWNIENQADGSIRLRSPIFGYADEISWNGAYSPEVSDLPNYEKERRIVEHEMTLKMCKQLEIAMVGDRFIWSSPPPEGIANDSYGGYTMTHVFEVDQLEDGQKVWKGRDILHKADKKKQKEVLEDVSINNTQFSENPTAVEILGELIQVDALTSYSDIEQKFKQGVTLEELSQEEKKLEVFNRILEKNRIKVQAIHTHLKLGNDSLALTLFNDWVENINSEWEGILRQEWEYIKRQTKQVSVGKDSWDVLSRSQDEYTDIPPHMRMQGFSSTATEVVQIRGGSCGKGFGMSGVNEGPSSTTVIQQQEVFGYTPVLMAASLTGNRVIEQKTDYLNDPELCRCGNEKPHFHCPGEIKTKEGKEEPCSYKVIVGKGITKCPECGAGKIC